MTPTLISDRNKVEATIDILLRWGLDLWFEEQPDSEVDEIKGNLTDKYLVLLT